MKAIRKTYPDITPEHIHIWTLGGKSREMRIGEPVAGMDRPGGAYR